MLWEILLVRSRKSASFEVELVELVDPASWPVDQRGSKENIVKWCEGLKQSVSLRLTVFLEDSWSVVVHDLMWWGVLDRQLVDVCCVGICVSCNLLKPHRDSGINHALVWGTRMMDFVICVDSKSSSWGSCSKLPSIQEAAEDYAVNGAGNSKPAVDAVLWNSHHAQSRSGNTLLHIPTSVLFCKTGWKTSGKHIAAIAIDF